MTLEFGFYRIEKDYIAHLRKNDPAVSEPEQNLYIGPVMYIESRGREIPMFAPVDADYKPDGSSFIENYVQGRLAGIDLNRMIPCLPELIEREETGLPEEFTKPYFHDKELILKCAENNYNSR